MDKNKLYTAESLEFAIFCIENLADYLNVDSRSLYDKLKEKDIIESYIMSEY